jgi:biopolymer transport protein ExbD
MSAHSGEGADPNLTPMLDLVFQLITFFMLVINFKGATMDLTLKLPILGSARPLDYKGRYEPLLLNINSEGKVEAFNEKVNIDDFIKREARIVKSQLKANGEEPTKDGELPVPVVIRADKKVPFSLLNHVIRACQDQGYRQFALNAMTREDGS